METRETKWTTADEIAFLDALGSHTLTRPSVHRTKRLLWSYINTFFNRHWDAEIDQAKILFAAAYNLAKVECALVQA